MSDHTTHRPPRDCPVCGHQLTLTRLGCSSCGTELSGAFEACEFCALNDEDRGLLRVFLAARGNAKELARHLDVSYPTARARVDALLGKLGLHPPPPPRRLEVLEALARGEVDVDRALHLLNDSAEPDTPSA